jgi:hypothetical protein
MGKRERLLERWRDDPPKDAPVDTVNAVIDYFFPDSRVKAHRGSHIVIKDERLKNKGEFGPLGRFEIPVSGGQKVKGVYLQILAHAIDVLEKE